MKRLNRVKRVRSMQQAAFYAVGNGLRRVKRTERGRIANEILHGRRAMTNSNRALVRFYRRLCGDRFGRGYLPPMSFTRRCLTRWERSGHERCDNCGVYIFPGVEHDCCC